MQCSLWVKGPVAAPSSRSSSISFPNAFGPASRPDLIPPILLGLPDPITGTLKQRDRIDILGIQLDYEGSNSTTPMLAVTRNDRLS